MVCGNLMATMRSNLPVSRAAASVRAPPLALQANVYKVHPSRLVVFGFCLHLCRHSYIFCSPTLGDVSLHTVVPVATLINHNLGHPATVRGSFPMQTHTHTLLPQGFGPFQFMVSVLCLCSFVLRAAGQCHFLLAFACAKFCCKTAPNKVCCMCVCWVAFQGLCFFFQVSSIFAHQPQDDGLELLGMQSDEA